MRLIDRNVLAGLGPPRRLITGQHLISRSDLLCLREPVSDREYLDRPTRNRIQHTWSLLCYVAQQTSSPATV
jgi:hypothetical protein